MLPEVALIVEVPAESAEASPPALIVATEVVPDAQVTCEVMFCVVPLENVPSAVNWRVRPLAIVGFAGVTAIDVSVGDGAGLPPGIPVGELSQELTAAGPQNRAAN